MVPSLEKPLREPADGSESGKMSIRALDAGVGLIAWCRLTLWAIPIGYA